MHVDRSEGRAVRRCSHAVVVAGTADRANPALPDLQLFSFAGNNVVGESVSTAPSLVGQEMDQLFIITWA